MLTFITVPAANTFEWQNEVTVWGSEIFYISASQDEDELSIGYDVASLYTSDEVQLGLEVDLYNLFAPEDALPYTGFTGSVHYEYTDDDDSVVGLSIDLDFREINFATRLDWNVNDTEVDAQVGTGYTIFGLDGDVTTYWDIDDVSYKGLDMQVGYTWQVADRFTVRPNVTLPIDKDWNSGTLLAGISVNVYFYHMYEYQATVLRVIDGDTIEVDIDLGFSTIIKKRRVRFKGIDTPEVRTRDLVEKEAGLRAKERVEGLLFRTPHDMVFAPPYGMC